MLQLSPSSSSATAATSRGAPPRGGGGGGEGGGGGGGRGRADGAHGRACGDGGARGGGGGGGVLAWCPEWCPRWCWLRPWCPCGSGRSAVDACCGRAPQDHQFGIYFHSEFPRRCRLFPCRETG